MPTHIANSLIALFLLIAPAWACADSWSAAQFNIEIGSIIDRQDGLTLEPNEQGQILVSVPASGLTLSEDQQVSFQFKGAPPPRIYVVWRRHDSEELFQHGFAPELTSEPVADMAGVRGWGGQALSLELGFLVNPGQRVTLQAAAVEAPGIVDLAGQAWQSWSFFRPWLPIDINIYSGTRDLRKGPYPAQFFALLSMPLVICYLLVRRARFRWTEVALIVFGLWLLLDAFWQWRLWNQVGITRERYAGKSSVEKTLASDDTAIAQLAEHARGLVDNPDARVFIASQADSNGMRAAYYMSPFNTFWHRHGEELPQRKYLQQGDYILVLGPSAIRYNRDAGHIRLPSGEDLQVTELHATRQGLFLEVAQ